MDFRPKVLAVDDDPLMLELLREALEQAGAEPNCLESSQQAADLINREKFDGVFLDWVMPEMDGLELAQQIRWSKSNSLCPIVMVTGKTEPDSMRQCFRAGINFFLQKPASIEEIQHLVAAARDLMLQERLRYQRIPLKIPVLCEWEAQSLKQKAEGQCENVSSTGMRIGLDPTPTPGSLARLKFTLPGDSQPLAPTAFVVRLASPQQVGVRFINLTREDRWRLIEFSRSALIGSPDSKAAGSSSSL